MRTILALLALLVLSHPLMAAQAESPLGAQSVTAAVSFDPFSAEKQAKEPAGRPVTTWECTASGCKAVSRVPYANQHGQYPAAGSVCYAPSAVQRTTVRVTTEQRRGGYRWGGGRERFRDRRDRDGFLKRLFNRRNR